MFLVKAASNTFLILSLVTTAFAQRSESALPLTAAGINMGNTGGVFADTPTDVDMDRPRSTFERLERKFAASAPHVDSDVGFAPGVVSAAELRHPISRTGATLIQQAQKYASQGKHKEAIEVLKKGLQDSSAAPYVHGYLGIEYLKTGDPHTAIVHLKEAITLQPSQAVNHSNLGYALCLAGDRTAGEREIREALKTDRYFSKAHLLLGVILLDKPTSEARDQLLLVGNEMSLARLALAAYYARRGETASAQQELKAYLDSNHSFESAQLERWLAHTVMLSTPASAFGFPPAQN